MDTATLFDQIYYRAYVLDEVHAKYDGDRAIAWHEGRGGKYVIVFSQLTCDPIEIHTEHWTLIDNKVAEAHRQAYLAKHGVEEAPAQAPALNWREAV